MTSVIRIYLLYLETVLIAAGSGAQYVMQVTLRDRGSLLFLLGERRQEPLLATARFFDLAAVHGQGRLPIVLNLRMADVSQNAG